MSNLRAGVVASIRINPKDAQSILDVLEKAGVPTANMSFSAMTALALQSLLESARQSRLIPEPDPFDFLTRVGPYLKTKHSAKLAVTNTLHGMGAALQAPAMPPEAVSAPSVGPGVIPDAAPDIDPEVRRHATTRLTELEHKKDLIEDGVEGIVWSAEDEAEYKKYADLLFGA